MNPKIISKKIIIHYALRIAYASPDPLEFRRFVVVVVILLLAGSTLIVELGVSIAANDAVPTSATDSCRQLNPRIRHLLVPASASGTTIPAPTAGPK